MRHEVRALGAKDWEAVLTLLSACSLPAEDLEKEQAPNFVGAFEGTRLIAMGGLELLGKAALLRSVCVQPGARRQGLARKIVDDLESRAREAGVREVFLLTETAELFFEKRGYSRQERDTAPAQVAACSQFSRVCPASAAFMVKSLV